MTLIDSNFLIDIASKDVIWSKWSLAQIETAARGGPLLINDVVYAEASVRYARTEEFDEFLARLGATMSLIPREALFVAGKAFTKYRSAGGARTGVVPDFFIGAHAAVVGIPLLTRDVRRYRSYFPTAMLISPETP